jgi:hypothetical protein
MEMGKLKALYNRIYADYLMPSRLNEYEKIITSSISLGYTHITLRDYYTALDNNQLTKKKKYFIHRHDIDTDIRTTKKMFEIEKKHNIQTTYYFRLSTITPNLMHEIEQFGSEASYHFEEIASYCKRNKLTSRKKALDEIEKIKNEFSHNFKKLESDLGYKFETVDSHGDFFNRKLNLINNEITNDYNLRQSLGINCEAYDSNLHDSFDAYISDKPYPKYYSPENIFDVIGKADVICMLTHPRQWETNFWVNTKDNILRFIEGMKFKF